MDSRLVPATRELLDAAVAGSIADALDCIAVPGWVSETAALAYVRDHWTASGWESNFFLADGRLVGWGGYKGPPRDGIVEVGYEIAESLWNRGYATTFVGALVDHAFADDRVRTVIAHTLPEPNASNRVLHKLGFAFAGEATENGEPVWRHELARPV